MSDTMNWWARHYQAPWQEKAGNPDLPKWFRVFALALGSHKANGHATFQPGDVSAVLGRVDLTTGEFTPDRDVRKHIATAVRYGLLAKGSSVRCLVVPAHSVEGGRGGQSGAGAPCTWCHRNRKRESQS